MRSLFYTRGIVALLLLSSVASPAERAPALFVQAGTSRASWAISGATAAQTFVARADRIKFVSLVVSVNSDVPPRVLQSLNVMINEGQLDGPVVAISSRQVKVSTIPWQTFFVFDPAVEVTPGLRYVLQLRRGNSANIQPVWVGGHDRDEYPNGWSIIGRHAYKDDLEFNVGFFLPQIFEGLDRFVAVTEQGEPIRIAARATFTNDYIAAFGGTSLHVTSGVPGDEFGLLDAPGGEFMFGGAAVGSVSMSNNPATLNVVFNHHASAAAIQQAIRSISFKSAPPVPQTLPRDLVLEIAHPRLGTTREALLLQVWPGVGEQWSPPRIANAQRWLSGSPPTVIAAKGQTAPVIFDESELLAGNWPHLTGLRWRTDMEFLQAAYKPLPPYVLSVVTNSFSSGIHWTWLEISEDRVHATPAQSFEVLPIDEAIFRLSEAVRSLGVPHHGRLIAPLRTAKAAVIRGRFSTAQLWMQVFQSRLGQLVAPLYPPAADEFREAAQSVVDVLSVQDY